MRIQVQLLFLSNLALVCNSFAPASRQVSPSHGGARTYSKPSIRTPRPTSRTQINASFLDSLFKTTSNPFEGSKQEDRQQLETLVTNLVDALNQGDVSTVLECITDDCAWDDRSFGSLCVGKEQLERRLRLQEQTADRNNGNQQLTVQDLAVDPINSKIGVLFSNNGENQRACAMIHVDPTTQKISRVCLIDEPPTKGGATGLKILNGASKIMKVTGYNPAADVEQKDSDAEDKETQSSKSSPEQYFDAWNRRDMTAAVDVFADNISYEDTAFPDPFVGKEKLERHLNICADSFPPTFTIVIDAVAQDTKNNRETVEWHLENQGERLIFTQGCSFYELSSSNNQLIESGIDFVEPAAAIKPKDIQLAKQTLLSNLQREPMRWIPLVSWVAYMYIVFFSDGILPGANALQLEARTWEEVVNLSLNFFLVSPLLNLPFSPSVHPMLEGVFNLLLSWAAMFTGFLSDDRRNKPNFFPMLPTVVGMQFLTSAFLLPYLVMRSSETDTNITNDDLPVPAQVAGESRLLAPPLTIVGAGSIAWFFLGRTSEYGSDFATRWSSFIDLLSIDRVGSSFLVDLAIFALFQGWLVDDDLKRRGVPAEQGGALALVGKFVPFFGLAAYLTLRPAFPDDVANEGNS